MRDDGLETLADLLIRITDVMQGHLRIPPMATRMSNQTISTAFNAIIEKMGRNDLSEILMNWNDSELEDASDRIILYPGRDRQWSKGREGGKVTVSKREFFDWLYSEEPFDQAQLDQSPEWVSMIERARVAARFTGNIPDR